MSNKMYRASAEPRRLPYHLLEKMTNDFSEDRVLGKGGFGTVYLGVDNDGEKIAVKVLHPIQSVDDPRFNKEFHNLKGLQHRHIVRFVGFSYESHHECTPYNGGTVLAEVIKRALCFEYMPTNLDGCLSDESSGHDWHTRYAMIKGICEGLKYLHEELQPPMLHLDLKPANILLDEDMVAKLADFGLSMFIGEEQSQITTTTQGTIGYLPREYIDDGIITDKLDIFSLGVVIIKIMTGREGYSKCCEMPSNDFIQLVHENWRSRLHAKSAGVLESYSEQVRRCMEISLSCIADNRHQRPSIGDIINKLKDTEIMIHERKNERDIVNELNETEPTSQFPDTSHNAPGSSMDQWTNRGMEPPRAFDRRLVHEYDRGSSSGAGSSSMARAPPLPLTTPKREEEELDGLDCLPPVVLMPDDFADEEMYQLCYIS